MTLVAAWFDFSALNRPNLVLTTCFLLGIAIDFYITEWYVMCFSTRLLVICLFQSVYTAWQSVTITCTTFPRCTYACKLHRRHAYVICTSRPPLDLQLLWTNWTCTQDGLSYVTVANRRPGREWTFDLVVRLSNGTIYSVSSIYI